MYPRPIVHDPDVMRLQTEKYEMEVRNGHLLLHSIPYVTEMKEVKRGILITDLNGNIGALGRPNDHQVWFVGEYPCKHSGVPIEAIRHTSGPFKLFDGFEAQHRFSNKPAEGFPDYYSKMKSYISIISSEAAALDPEATPCTGNIIIPAEENSVFRYWDSASSRANIMAVSEKLTMEKVAIIGLGGTGSYVLDLVTKTPVWEIHLFDGDVFEQHNAFRSPGAVSIETLEKAPFKVDYYARVNDSMRTGIVSHIGFVTEENVGDLEGFGFVFLCVDNGSARKVISGYLRSKGIPFIDVGMDLTLIPEEAQLFGTCRMTFCSPTKSDHFDMHAPQGTDDDDDDLYKANIQVADLNALNATLAVIKWKQFCGFYADHYGVHHTTFSIDSHSLTRDETTGAGSCQ